ncbi:MAG: hypothetical protein RMI79_06715 [Nitrososphaerota archaeon]|nr:hypothetical protein [Nitrososphaerota archaeon]
MTIPDGSDRKDFYYYDDKAGTWNIQVSTDDYLYLIPTTLLITIITIYYNDG